MQANLLLHTHLADIELIPKIKAGRTECFELLVRRHNRTLYRIGRSMGFAPEDAETLMELAHLQAFADLAQFDVRHSYRNWLCSKMMDICMERLQSGLDERGYASASGFEEGGDVATAAPTSTRKVSVFEESLEALPPSLRLTFVLCEIEGFSIREAAMLMQKDDHTAATRLHRAKASVRDQLLKSYYSSDIYCCNAECTDRVVKHVMGMI